MLSSRFPQGLADYCLFHRLREGLADKVAIRFGPRAYTYRQVAERASAFARYLRDAGVAEQDRVYIALPDSPAFVWAFFGVLACGGIVTMGNPDAPAPDLAATLDYVRARACVTVPRVARALGSALGERHYLHNFLLVPEVATGADV